MTLLALLRGINVGGKNIVPMRELAALFASTGCGNVRTHIQSGNVLFETGRSDLDKLAADLATAIASRFSFRVPVLLRTSDQLQAVLKSNPYLLGAVSPVDENQLHVYFLDCQPTSGQIALLDPARSLPDTFVLQGCEVYLRLPNGMGRTRLTNAYFDAKLKTVSTARNWRTITKLYQLMVE